jgi:DNA-binding CsgD family transcriptional regulator/PAS domain-containing protein
VGLDAKVFSRALGLLYDGLLWPERWNDFLAELRKGTGHQAAAITFHDSGNETPVMGFSMGMPEEVVGDWTNYYGSRNPRTPEIMRALSRRETWVTASSWHELPGRFRQSEYVAWLRRVDWYHSLILAAPLGSGIGSLGLARPRSAPPFPQDGLGLMKRLAPHLRRVLEIHSSNQTLRTLFEAGKIALDSLDTGVVAVDGQNRVLWANERAASILEKGRGITSSGGRLGINYPSEAAHLEQLVRSATMGASGNHAACGGAIAIHASDSLLPLSVVVAPGNSNRIPAGSGRPCALIFIYDPTAKPASRMRVLQALFGLTPAESRFVSRLLDGMDLSAAAVSVGVTSATARFMLKVIFRKTGVHRQSELIRLLSGIPGEPRTSESGLRGQIP